MRYVDPWNCKQPCDATCLGEPYDNADAEPRAECAYTLDSPPTQ